MITVNLLIRHPLDHLKDGGAVDNRDPLLPDNAEDCDVEDGHLTADNESFSVSELSEAMKILEQAWDDIFDVESQASSFLKLKMED